MREKTKRLGQRIIGFIVLGVVGGYLFPIVMRLIANYLGDIGLDPAQTLIGVLLTGALCGAIGWMFAPRIYGGLRVVIEKLGSTLERMTVGQVSCAVVGMFIGTILAMLMSLPFLVLLPRNGWASIAAILCALSGITGFAFGAKRWGEMLSFVRRDRSSSRLDSRRWIGASAVDKILDTNVIIDGRILDILATGFIEGVIVIPQFVLAELRHIADSQDPLRRSRGRRGLDILNRMQEELQSPLEIDESMMEGQDEVDVKLLKLAQKRNASVVTNDFNLNKVAAVTGVRVLNINDLVNALKPVLISGEECAVQIVKEGREPGQGVGYLDDGTMIVVDNARRLIGETVDVVVTNILQTAAGRMIFGRTKNSPTPQRAVTYASMENSILK